MDPSTVLNNILQLIQMLVLIGERLKHHRTNCQNLVMSLKLLRPMLDEVQESKLTLTTAAIASFELLEQALEDVKNLIERCARKGSKVYLVLRSHQIVNSFEEVTLETVQVLTTLPLTSLRVSEHSRVQVERCIQELKRTRFLVDISDERLSEEIGILMKEQREGQKIRSERLQKLANKLEITSSESLLRELDALEKEREQARLGKDKMEEDYVDRVISLLMQVLEGEAEYRQAKPEVRGIPIPTDFRCPLSLELMADPVIVASGQTYERAYIQQWLDQGNTTCPKTRQTLAHTNLIPNYTVKALITNWCEANNVPLPEPAKLGSLASLPNQSTGLLATKVEYSEPLHGSRTEPSMQAVADTDSRPKGSEHAELDKEGTTSGMNQEAEGNIMGSGSSPTEGDNILITKVNVDNEGSGHNRTTSGSSAASSVDEMQMSPAQADGASNMNDSSPYHSGVSGELETAAMTVSGSPSHAQKHGFTGAGFERDASFLKRHMLDQNINPESPDGKGSDASEHLVIEGLVKDLLSDSVDVQRNAASELRLLAKFNMENRIRIANAGAIRPLVVLLDSSDPKTQENAVTALLNLSIYDNNKAEIAANGAIDPLVHVLKVGTPEAMENAAATLFSLSVMDENKVTIGASGAIPPLVDLLIHGTPRGKKDAATALFNLSIFHENKGRIVGAGAVKPLVELMTEPAAGMVDKAVAVLANLATIPEGRVSIGEEGGIPALVEVVEAGSQRGKENAAAALLHLCMSSNRHRAMVLQEGAIPPLHALSQSGTARAKEKASALLRHFREQRHGSFGARPGPDRHVDRHS
ncbi:hypothetical protein O6H91_05G104000 [Diphasiastrum complanatum]|uniref:Uncharacterized protein n=1 Tax=Diphasiastrum complanatum TaxID=34168 RepID=A0ACC2DS17_DIPCM|nr:hypothetical protein O6H91_05G104000 [Diphasiastrum complanatum]